MATYNVLIMGASYGSLLGTKLLMAGHRVTLVCTPPTAELINREGTVVRFPMRDQPALLAVALAVSKNDEAAIRAAAKNVPDLQAAGRDGETLLYFAVDPRLRVEGAVGAH